MWAAAALCALFLTVQASVANVASLRRLQQLPEPQSFQQFIAGTLQHATLDASCANDPHCGGSLTVNGQVVTVPKNMLVFFPAQAYTWQEIFTNGVSGLALDDPPSPPGYTYSVAVTANQVNGQTIAAFVDITQDPVFAAAGFIEAIDFLTGTLTVGGVGGKGSAQVRLNDPTGRYGKPQQGGGFDPRFAVDPDNPTVSAITGFPMCIPTGATDPKCPQSQRPINPATGKPSTIFEMTTTPGTDAKLMAPLVVGDYVFVTGVITTGGFVAAFQITANAAIYTPPGRDPAYVIVEKALMGTGGINIPAAEEGAVRSVFEGFTTDPTRPIQLYALDFDAATGAPTARGFGQVMPDPGPAAPIGAVKGRWKFQSPCVNPFGPLTPASPFQGGNSCTPPAAGVYLPPPREVMAAVVGCAPVPGAANGLNSGINTVGAGGCFYRTPSIEFIWPEQLPGAPVVEANFKGVPFLTVGGYASSKGTRVGALDPWPSNVLPPETCGIPLIDTGGPYSVSPGGVVTLTATVTGPGGPFLFNWKSNVASGGSSFNPNSATATFAPISGNSTYTLTVTNACGQMFAGQAVVTISTKPVILAIPQKVLQSDGKINLQTTNLRARLSGTEPAVFTWILPPPLSKVRQSPNPGLFSTIAVSVPVLTFGALLPATYSVSVSAASGGSTSAPVAANITVLPPRDTLVFGAVSFTCAKHTLTLSVVSNLVSPDLVLTLQPYVDNRGRIFRPATLGNPVFTNNGAGSYSLSLQPCPLPNVTVASLTVTSSVGGKVVSQMPATAVVPAKNNVPVCQI